MSRFGSKVGVAFRVYALFAAISLIGLASTACDSDDSSECSPEEEGCEPSSNSDTSSPPSCLSGTYGEPDCNDCAPGEYCEPGSSAAGIKCLQLCDVDADCCSPLTCMQNEWVYSYQGTICSTNGL